MTMRIIVFSSYGVCKTNELILAFILIGLVVRLAMPDFTHTKINHLPITHINTDRKNHNL